MAKSLYEFSKFNNNQFVFNTFNDYIIGSSSIITELAFFFFLPKVRSSPIIAEFVFYFSPLYIIGIWSPRYKPFLIIHIILYRTKHEE